MGLFSKIKQNFSHGIDIAFDAPNSVSIEDAVIPVTVNVTATKEQQTINRVSVEIIAESRNKSFNTHTSSTAASEVDRKTVARSEYAQPFLISPGETKQLQIQLSLSAGAALNQVPQDGAAAQIAGAFQKLNTFMQSANLDSYTYFVVVYVDVAGVAFDPSEKKRIQILRPGQIGGSIGFGGA